MKRRDRNYSGTRNPAESHRERKNKEIAKRAAGEGIVLLRNRNHLLPLQGIKKIALFGSGAQMTIKGGTGSGDVNERASVNILEGLENAGFVVTTKRWIGDYRITYEAARKEWKERIEEKAEGLGPNEFFSIYSSNPFRIPCGRAIDERDVREADTETALFVLSRIAGEGADRYETEGDYYLTEEEYANLSFVCRKFAHVILIINTGAQIDLSQVETFPHMDSILYMVQAGMEGGNALAEILSGKVTPSGKLTDTWAKTYGDYPASKTFSHNNGNVEKEYYREGIYVGYRYFDSFGLEPLYPFGFGLSYTEFEIIPGEIRIKENRQEVLVHVRVKNVGETFAGKEVVQVYASCPQNGLDKEYRRLLVFGKTRLLNPGEEETLTVGFPVKFLASYREKESAWVAEKGLYGIWVGNSSRKLSLLGALKVERDNLLEKVKPICKKKEDFEELVCPKAEALIFEKRWRSEIQEKNLPVHILEAEEESHPSCPETEEERWGRELAEKLSDEELISMVVGEISKGQSEATANALGSAGILVPGAAGETSSILLETYGIPGLPMADGPAGLRLAQTYEVSEKDGNIYPKGLFDALEGGIFAKPEKHEGVILYYQYCTAIPVGTLLAQTWNEDLLLEVGAAVGREMQEFGITWWLAPGLNIHRDPLCGRNFEYFSEDPVVSGRMAAAITKGVQSERGVGTTIKHFACNNQEDNRKGSDSILSERALRELYLKGFEIAVKESQPMAMMTSYNLINGVHTANSRELCTQVAREEWGFRGIIMTDWTTTDLAGGSVPYKCIAAGNDLIMPGGKEDLNNIREALKENRLKRPELQACAGRLIAKAYQSNGYEEAKSYGRLFQETGYGHE